MKRVPPEELPYTIASFDIVEETPELRVVVIALAEHQEIPWHYHTRVTDSFFCLAGHLHIERGSGLPSVALRPGDSLQISPQTNHRVSGIGGGACRFLLVQGIGSYDFVPVEP